MGDANGIRKKESYEGSKGHPSKRELRGGKENLKKNSTKRGISESRGYEKKKNGGLNNSVEMGGRGKETL